MFQNMNCNYKQLKCTALYSLINNELQSFTNCFGITGIKLSGKKQLLENN